MDNKKNLELILVYIIRDVLIFPTLKSLDQKDQ